MKIELLKAVADEIASCRKCPELCNRLNPVPGRGSPDASVLIVGEAPGQDEDASGLPFVGKAGQLLNSILAACNWQSNDVFILNTLKCRPPGNRTPTTDEVNNCFPFLERQIEIINPRFILCMGSSATSALLGIPVSQARRSWHTFRSWSVLATWHPAALFHDPGKKPQVWEDLQPLLRELGQIP